MPSVKWGSGDTGHKGLFGDSFFSDCWDVMDGRRDRRLVHEDIASDVAEERVKPWFRKTNLSRMSDDDIYQVMLEVSNFTPAELTVRLLNDKTVVVEGKHGERKDTNGFISREFTRKYPLPEGVLPSSVECHLSKDGVLVIRGQAPKSKASITSGRFSETQKSISNFRDENPIPIFTKGFSTATATANGNGVSNGSSSNGHQKERVIPISQENGVGKPPTSSNGATSGNGATEDKLFWNRNKDRSTMSPSPSPQRTTFDDSLNSSGRRSRTVSFNDDDTIASNSPIIEEPPSVSSNAPTPEPSTSRRSPLPPFSRQNQRSMDDSFSEVRSRSSSRMSEERFERSQSPLSPNPPPKKVGGNRIETINIDLDAHPSTTRRYNSLLDRGTAGELDLFRNNSGDPFEGIDKWHKEVAERHRHLSRESLNRMKLDSDKFLQETRSRSPLFRRHHASNDELFDSSIKSWDNSPLFGKKWETTHIPPKTADRQYEKKHEKGYDKNGNWTETTEERMYSQQHSSSSSNDSSTNKSRQALTNRSKPLEHGGNKVSSLA